MSPKKSLLLVSLLAAGCISSSGGRVARPNLTALEHEDEARRAEQLAAQHERRRDPDLYSIQRCGGMGSPSLQGPSSAPQAGFNASGIPTPLASPTCGSWFDEKRDHEVEADRQRWIAAQHRAAAARIRSVEARACYDLSSAERMARPIQTREDLLAVRTLPDYSRTGKAASQHGGATVLLREQPGMNAQSLERVLRCDAARALVEGGADRTPWAVPGSQAAVVQTDHGLLVEVTADDRETVLEIERRAARLSESVR
jgi:hypothetical protein